ncbi:Gp15 family bacteriophage protein [Paenibacillus thiaminolyticus]|uniref:Gp15 family bacteriophage protein n=1 Tax=Paenibacillus thiaminolyticus TaxID=49283 RepID=UPI003D29F508
MEASFAAQYGIRLRADPEMTWSEFSTLLAGIMPETPLGQIVSIRAENDREKLKLFTSEQKRIRTEWRNRQLRQVKFDPNEAAKAVAEFEKMIAKAFG